MIEAAPGPVKVRSPAMLGRAEANVMVPLTPAWKEIVSAPAAAFASIIACRSDPAPALFRFKTTKLAPLTGSPIHKALSPRHAALRKNRRLMGGSES